MNNDDVVVQQMVERLRACVVSVLLRFVAPPPEERPAVEQWARAIPLGRIYKLGPDGGLAPDVDPTIAIPLFLADVAIAGVGREHELSNEVVEREMEAIAELVAEYWPGVFQPDNDGMVDVAVFTIETPEGDLPLPDVMGQAMSYIEAKLRSTPTAARRGNTERPEAAEGRET
jgi:hypothetical protein